MSTVPRSRSRRLIALAAATSIALTLVGCGAGGSPADNAAPPAAGEQKTSFKIGTGSDNPLEAGVVGYLAEVIAPDHGITIEVVELEDSRHLNEAVDAGELDGHVAVHAPYLESVLAQQPDWELAPSTPLYSSLLTLASKRHSEKDPKELRQGATVSISEDPSNTARSLVFLQNQGFITLKSGVDIFTATIEDIEENPFDITIVPVDGGALARSLDDVDYSVLQASYLRAASIGDEVQVITVPQDERLAIILVTRAENADSDYFKLLRDAISDPRLDDFIDAEFGDIAAGVR